MATYYVKPADGGGAGAGTEGDPWNGFTNITGLTNNDTLILTTGTFKEELKAPQLPAVTGFTLRGQGAGVTIIDAEDTRATACTLASFNGDVEDITFTRGTGQGLLITNSSLANYALTVRRCHATNCRTDSTTTGKATGFLVDNANNYVANVTFIDCQAYDNGRMGFDTQEWQGTLTRINCKAYRNGDLGEGGGFFTHPWRTTKTSGWSAAGGGVYSRAVDSALDGFTGMYNSTDSVLLQITTGTSPAAGYCSASGGNWYIHLAGDADPNTKSIIIGRSAMVVRDYGCEAYDNGGYDEEHGTGFHYDDLTRNLISVGCSAHDNTGNGFQVYLGSSDLLTGCIAYNNGSVATGTNSQRADFLFTGYDLSAYNISAYGSPCAVAIGQGTTTVVNLASQDNTLVLLAENAGTLTVDYYLASGQTTLSSTSGGATINATNRITGGPAFVAPGSGNMALGDEAGKSTGVWKASAMGFDQLPIPLRPDIGAVQDRNAPGRRFGVGGGSL